MKPYKPYFRNVLAYSKGGWTKWIRPRPDSYLMKCCGCGLVHEMQFRIVGKTEFRARRKP